ncbi:hypothetical protein [Ancylobacter radicis]|uniref:Uncharacterized protein n=1 Tax=Ancylobacter radicis TaxID=2836179 RepID=A0ABS5R554_9HYPH|nr:hypothetical protein [Ancylobacter radicis]MBS9475512.1 hypothetical protein [Ancylobacter radicis]
MRLIPCLISGLVVAAAFAAPAAGQSRPDSLRMSCAATAGMVRQQGQVVIGTGPNIYDRYVSNQRYCSQDETTVPVWLQTTDQNQCFIGYRCRERIIRQR